MEHYQIGDVDLSVDNDNVRGFLHHLELRISRLERAMATSRGRISKETPLLTLIYKDKVAERRIHTIYKNWISYMTKLATYLNGIDIDKTFWCIDKYIFEGFFTNYIEKYKLNISFVPLSLNVSLENQYQNEKNFLKIVNYILNKTRNPDFSLSQPRDKEFISSGIVDKVIYILYFPEEINLIAKGKLSHQSDVDIQLNHKYDFNNLVTNDNVLHVESSQENIVKPTKKTYYNGEVLYTTIVEAGMINDYDHSLYSVGQVATNISIVLYHAMLHLKIALVGGNEDMKHDDSFVNDFINYTPSVLYGHFTLPIMSI